MCVGDVGRALAQAPAWMRTLCRRPVPSVIAALGRKYKGKDVHPTLVYWQVASLCHLVKLSSSLPTMPPTILSSGA